MTHREIETTKGKDERRKGAIVFFTKEKGLEGRGKEERTSEERVDKKKSPVYGAQEEREEERKRGKEKKRGMKGRHKKTSDGSQRREVKRW